MIFPRLRTLSVFITLFLLISIGNNLFAQAVVSDPCQECPPPAKISQGGKMDLELQDHSKLPNCLSIKRVIIHRYDRDIQALQAWFSSEKGCRDTVLEMKNVTSLSFNEIGISGQTLRVPIYPAREFFRKTEAEPSGNSISINPFIGYGGNDSSRRKVGFPSVYYGIEVLVAPFGNLLGNKTILALSGAALFEGGRLRIPLGGNIKWTFLGAEHVEEATIFKPGPCKFTAATDPMDSLSPAGFEEVPSKDVSDPNVFYIHEKTLVKDSFRPFLYLEGGIILNGSFDGAGKNPSVNPDDYGQYYAGAGLGLPIADWFQASLGYRYMRLNLRTPCAVCPADIFIQNTNISHSILLKIGVKFP